MNTNTPIDLRHFSLKKLPTPEYRHLLYLIYWPLFGLIFLALERFWIRDYYYPVHCGLDDLIPFCEYFLIPYLFWFVYLIGMHIYTALYEPESFVRLMRFIMLTYSAAVVIFLLVPTCQNLRPAVFPRDNAFTRFIAGFYLFDTNTNVCPSLHVVGSLAVLFTAWHTRRFSTPGWKWAFTVAAVLICVSTVFLKQHSCIDILMGLVICSAAYRVVFHSRRDGHANTYPCRSPSES